MSRQSITSLVYFVRCPANGLIKIGYTGYSDLGQRFELLTSSSPVPLEILGVIPASKEFEKSMHVAFAATWHHNEWFEPSPELVAFIAREIPPWRGNPAGRDMALVNVRRRAELLALHADRYGLEGCPFEGACPDCGEFVGPGQTGPCIECEMRAEAEVGRVYV